MATNNAGEPVHQSDELPKNEISQAMENGPAISEIAAEHQLKNKWTLFFYQNKSKVWKENISELAIFDTVEDFWCLFNYIKPPSQLSKHCDYSYFKNGIKPMLEDEKNGAGGRWLLKLPLIKNNPHIIDNYWKQLIMSIISEEYDQSNEINGATITVNPKNTTIAVWTNNASKDNGDNILAIGQKMKEVLAGLKQKIVYESHVARKQGSYSKPFFHI